MDISIESIRNAGGFNTEIITDAQIEQAIEITKNNVNRYMNTKLEPEEVISVLEGNNDYILSVDDGPILRIDELWIGTTKIDVKKVIFNNSRIELKKDAELRYFINCDEKIRVRYYYGYLVNSFKVFSLEDIEAGEGVSFEVESINGLSVGDWLSVVDISGRKQAVKIIDITDNIITIDKSLYSYSGSYLIYKLDAPDYIRRYIELESAIYLAINVIGATYTFNTGYTLGDLSAQKGVPYPHWAKSVDVCMKERDRLNSKIKTYFRIV